MLFAAGLVVVSITACARARLVPDSVDAAWAATRWPGTTAADLDAGYEIYRGRCAGCHHLPLPTAHGEEKWRRAMQEMAPKAKLTPEEHDLVLRYILAVRVRGEGEAPESPPPASGAQNHRAPPAARTP
jgi:mono/diheme cytochrome c family protein